jgi:hypothetical protein
LLQSFAPTHTLNHPPTHLPTHPINPVTPDTHIHLHPPTKNPLLLQTIRQPC